MAQSVLRDQFPCHLPSLDWKRLRESKERREQGKSATVDEWCQMLAEGKVKNRAELARRLGISRARVTQALRAGV